MSDRAQPAPAFGPLPGRVLWQGAAVMAGDGAGRVLMQLRDSRTDIAAPGLWSFFGGALEPGEAPGTAARREFFEETGIDISADPLEPLARVASQATKDGVVHVFRLARPLAPGAVRLGEGAGFAFLNPTQIETYPLITSFREILRAHPAF